jgi:hypothetical protein
MKRYYIFTFLIFVTNIVYSQQNSQNVSSLYLDYSKKADDSYLNNNFIEAVKFYKLAFDANGGVGRVIHRYNLASCWANLDKPDSAFVQLERIAEKGNFSNVELISMDFNLKKLHSNVRWKPLIERIKRNNNLKNKN